MMENISFANPNAFFLLIIIPLYIAWYIWKRASHNATIQISTLEPFDGLSTSWKSYLRHLPVVLRMAAIALAVVVLARPQSSDSYRDEKKEGIDIVVSLDISGSMLAVDFKPNRLEAAKDIAMKFISGRPDDNIGLVIFGGESFTQCPLTTDHTTLLNLFADINTGLLSDGTAIGMGLATSVSRIKDSVAKSKVIILMTDGMNNCGSVAPIKAAELAQTFGVRVYTIGIGTIGTAQMPYNTPYGIQYQDVEVKIDEDLLRQIADMTGGKYFRATDNKSLKSIYEEIDQLEKTILEVREYSKRNEEYLPFAIAAALLLLAELLLRNTILRTLP